MGPNSKAKKELERSVCERFIQALPELNLSMFLQANPPLPDIILEDNISLARIGLEITRSIQPVKKGQDISLLEQYKFQKKVLKRAAELFHERFSYKVYCTIRFGNLKIGKHEVDKFLNPLIDFIHNEMQRRELNNESLTFLMISEETELPVVINYLNVNKFSQEIALEWGVNGMHDWPPYLTLEPIEKIIRKKEKSLKEYEGKFSSNWLLIYEYEIGTWFEKKQVFEEFTVKTTFGRVFLLSHGLELYELNAIKESIS